MNKQTEMLQNENNQACEQLNEENNKIYTDICVYIRSFSCSDYQQEVLRSDILRMMLDGQKRGASMQDVIGDDYQSFCDQIYAEIPKMSKSKQWLSTLGTLCYCIALLLGIWLVFGVVDNVTAQTTITKVAVTSGDLVSFILILITAFVLVNHLSKHAFIMNNKKTMLVFALCAILIIVVNVTMRVVLFQVSIYIGLAIVILCYVFHRAIERRID